MSYEDDVHMSGEVSGVALGKASTGNVQLAISFLTDDDEHRQVIAYLYFTDKRMPYTEADLRTLGWDPVENGWNIDDMLERNLLVGAKADLVCAYEQWEGKDRFKVKFINTPGGGVKERLSSDEAKAFTTQLRARLGVTGGVKKPVARKAAKVTKPATKEEVPF